MNIFYNNKSKISGKSAGIAHFADFWEIQRVKSAAI